MSKLYINDPDTNELLEIGKDGPLPVELPFGDSIPVHSHAAIVDVDLTVEASALDANDVAAATQEVRDFSRIPGGCAELRSLQVIDADDQKAEIHIVFFDAAVVFGTEDSAVSISDIAARAYLGHVLVAAADYVDLVGVSVACKVNLGLMLQAASGSTSIYVAAWTTGTPTYAGGILRLRLGLKRY